MPSIRSRSRGGHLFFDFHYRGKRCREQTLLKDTSANRKKLQRVMDKIEAEITLGMFNYANYFPNSANVRLFVNPVSGNESGQTPRFKEFARLWLNEMSVQWRKTHFEQTKQTLEKYIYPYFANKRVGCITKAEILNFRSKLAKVTKRNGTHLSATRINHIITPLRMILNEAANRYEFTSPYHGIKSLKVKKVDVEPFSLDEVKSILQHVRKDFQHYYAIRFFTGMRTGEIDGLQWKYVDFERRQILVRNAWVRGELIGTKNDSSFRTIDMSDLVYQALRAQTAYSAGSEYVFCTRTLAPLNHNNVTKRVWKPLLTHLGLRYRRPYQTRHTAATLWLAAGESPEWIARQMGHTTTEMLFRVYSRYVPNLTRKDGTAMEKLLLVNGLTEKEVLDD